MMHPNQHTLRYPQAIVTALADRLRISPTENAFFSVKEAAHGLLTDSPQLGDFRHRVVPFQGY
jgi:hypothetical protein